MLNKSLVFSAFLALGVASQLASASITTTAAAVTAYRSLPTEFVIDQILINPTGNNDETQGREFITVKGPANTSLNDYYIVVIENENGGGGNDGRGTIDNIIPLDGISSNSSGYAIVRDSTGNGSGGTTLGDLGDHSVIPIHEDPFKGLSNEKVVDFETRGTKSISAGHGFSAGTLHFGGNSLENGGGTYLLVKFINPALDQQHDSGGNKIDGTTVDSSPSTSKGTFGTTIAETIVDSLYVGEGSDSTGFGTSLDYCTNITASAKGFFPLAHSNWQYNASNGTDLSSNGSGAWNHTPDFVVRLWDSSGDNARPLTHSVNDQAGTTVTMDDVLATELSTTGSLNDYFDQTPNTKLWDLTTVSAFTSTKAWGSPDLCLHPVNFTIGLTTYYMN